MSINVTFREHVPFYGDKIDICFLFEFDSPSMKSGERVVKTMEDDPPIILVGSIPCSMNGD